MGVSVFPAPSAGGGAALPQGAVANVASGYSATGGWRYATSTNAGTYQVSIQAPSNQIYGIETANGIVESDIPGGSVIPLKTTATEASITVGSYHPFQVTQFSASNGTLRNMNAGNGLHILTTNTGYIYTSPDSLTWTNRTSGGEGTQQNNTAPTYVNDRWIIPGWNAAATNGRGLLHSTNGTTWTTLDLTSVLGSRMISVLFANGLWIVWCSNGLTTGQIGTSTNFSSWTARTTPTTNSVYSITYANVGGTNYYIAGCSGGILFYSTDGATWTSTSNKYGSRDIYSIINGNGRIIIAGVNGSAYNTGAQIGVLTPSDTGVPDTWVDVLLANNLSIGSTFGTGGYFLGTFFLFNSANNNTASGTGIISDGSGVNPFKCLTSPDGYTWTLRNMPSSTRSTGPLQQQANGIVSYVVTERLYATTAFNSAAIHINSTALTSV
jgi:hypothetical protein